MISDSNIVSNITNNQIQYIPKVGDHIIGIITNKNNDYYTVNINNIFNGYIMCIDGFRGTTKKYKPTLNIGDVIFCYVYSINNNNLIELSCITTDDNKNWSTNETYFGQLSGGFLFPVPLNYIKTLYGEDNLATQLLSNFKYEIVLGFNERVWIGNANSNELILKISRFIKLSYGLNELQTKLLFKKIF